MVRNIGSVESITAGGNMEIQGVRDYVIQTKQLNSRENYVCSENYLIWIQFQNQMFQKIN